MAEHPKQAEGLIDTSATRRGFLKQGAALGVGASLMSMVPPGVRSAAWAAGSDAPEKKEVKIGFIPLCITPPRRCTSAKTQEAL